MNRTVLLVGLFIAAALVLVLLFGVRKDPQAIDSPLVGAAAPPFALREVGTGQTISLTQFRGKPVVLNFWATWCGPCYEEHPTLVANARALPDVQFVGVVFQDTEDKIQKFNDEQHAYQQQQTKTWESFDQLLKGVWNTLPDCLSSAYSCSLPSVAKPRSNSCGT